MGFFTALVVTAAVVSVATVVNAQKKAKQAAAQAQAQANAAAEQAAQAQAQADAQADAAKGFNLISEGSVGAIPLVYGRAKIGGQRVWTKTANGAWMEVTGYPMFSRNFPATPGFTNGTKNEFLFFQQVICQAPIHSVVSVLVNDKEITAEDYQKGAIGIGYALSGHPPAAPMIYKNFFERTTAFFAGYAYLNTIIRLDRDDPQFTSIPNIQSIVEGRVIRRIEKTVGGNYYVTGRSYSNNPAFCLLDYLLYDDNESISNANGHSVTVAPFKYVGLGLREDQIDLESFYKAAQVCNKIVKYGAPVSGKVWTNKGITVRDIPLYECNLVIDQSQNIRSNVEKILYTMGDARLVWSNGKYKLLLQYPMS